MLTGWEEFSIQMYAFFSELWSTSGVCFKMLSKNRSTTDRSIDTEHASTSNGGRAENTPFIGWFCWVDTMGVPWGRDLGDKSPPAWCSWNLSLWCNTFVTQGWVLYISFGACKWDIVIGNIRAGSWWQSRLERCPRTNSVLRPVVRVSQWMNCFYLFFECEIGHL